MPRRAPVPAPPDPSPPSPASAAAGASSSPAPPERIAAFREALVAWYREHARDLPWRRDPDPWGVWVSEIMLQQTRVETVIPYWVSFLERFPTPAALASAAEEDVLEAWSGLGYYRRARQLRQGARRVVEDHAGRFPSGEADALALPGVGRYTAGAIRSIALGLRAPILDGNVTRVLSRVFGVRGDISKVATSRTLWAIAAEVVAADVPSDVNQGQMELGALICTPRRPECERCPVESTCIARAEGTIAELPELPAKRATVSVERTVLIVTDGDRALLRRRRADELLPGLWDLPGAFDGVGGDRSAGIEEALALLPFPVEPGEEIGTLRHAITHRRILLHVVMAAPAATAATLPPPAKAPARRRPSPPRGPDGAELAWFRTAELASAALSAPARKILAKWGPA